MSYVVAFFLLAGAGFTFIAALGIVRMPDIYCRMHAATKAGAFGVTLMLVALCFAMPTLRTIIEAVLIVVFFYMTAPVAAHMIGRVATLRNLPVWRHRKPEPMPSTTDSAASKSAD